MKQISIAIIFAFSISLATVGQEKGPTPEEQCRSVTAADFSDSKAPSFANYPAASRQEVGSSPKLDLSSNPFARRYRTVLRLEMAKGTNYAGHYRVAVWGCGSSCSMFAVVDLNTGRVITAKEFKSVSGVYLAADEFLPGIKSDYWGFRFKNTSSLLVALGAPDEDESRTGAYYFTVKGESLLLIHTTRVRETCENLKP